MVQRRAALLNLNRFSIHDSITSMLSELGWRSPGDRVPVMYHYKIVHLLVTVPLPPYVVLPHVSTQHIHKCLDKFIQLPTATNTLSFLSPFVKWNKQTVIKNSNAARFCFFMTGSQQSDLLHVVGRKHCF